MQKWLLLSFLVFSYESHAAHDTCSQEICSIEEACITPPVRNCCDTVGLKAKGEFLYLKASTDELFLSINTQFLPDLTNSTSLTGKPVEVDFKWDPGFRVGVGYDTLYDDWDLAFYWTYFHSEPKVSESVDLNNQSDFLFTLFATGVGSAAVAKEMNGSWRVKLNSLDLYLGRDFFISSSLSLKPYFGLKNLWLDQRVTANYSNIAFPVGFGPRSGMVNSDFWGIGPAIGLNSRWHFYQLGLFANVLGSGVYGRFKNTNNQMNVQTTPLNPNSLGLVTASSKIYRGRNILQMQVGLDWEKCFKDQFNLYLSIGYEFQYYYSFEEYIFFGESSIPQADLSLIGLNLSGRFSF